ncbi:glycosyltransferase family 4 protein [Nocardioides xinjiangensis]|uniref:glycosyltransferase family 4 protein n=1 Tax=Nocardioides xinjiangensis TaxID=2817376 RepID=UPI001B30D637|nr:MULTISPECIES: glycosyltransferase family 4 protein [unclassified Nocardioides]
MSEPGPVDVAVFVPGLDSGGGAEKTALVTARALADAGLTVTCFTDSRVSPGHLREHFGVDMGNVQLEQLPSPRVHRRLPRAVRDLVRDVAHVKAMRARVPGLFINMKFKSELPGIGDRSWYYTHFPHVLHLPTRSGAHAFYLRLVAAARHRLLLRGASRFIDTYEVVLANSEFTREHVHRRWNVDAITLHPPCAQLTGAAAADRAKTILNVGRFQADGPNIPHKRQDVLVQTLADMPDLAADGWSLHLVGAVGTSAADRAYLEHVRTMAHGLPVSLHPNASHELLSELSAHARLYWHAQGYGTDSDRHPEAQEHFGISTVEAMSAGIVPLVYATAGPAEVVQDEPDLTWRTPAELAAKTRALLDPERWTSWHERCRRRAEEFSTDAFSGCLRELYASRVGPLPAHRRGGG